MKRLFSIFSAVVLLAGCTKFEEQPQLNQGGEQNDSVKQSIYAGFADEESRAYVENDKDILWQNGDALSLFYAHFLNMKFEYKGEDGARMAKFDFVYGTGDPADSDAPYLKTHALYPYDERAISEYDAASQSFTISTHFPATQHYAPNSFGRGANLMVAVAHSSSNGMKDEQILFRNACGFFTVKLYGEGVKVRTITLTAQHSERIAGAATIRAHVEQAPVVTIDRNGSSHITLDCGTEGVALGADAEHATEFWFALPPTTFAHGVRIEVTDVNGTIFKKETRKEIVVERNKIKPMAALKFEQSVPNNNVLWYTRKEYPTTPYEWDAETNEELFDATITRHYYDPDNKRIVVEFATPLTTIREDAFRGDELGDDYRDMKTITFPNSLTTIEDYAFFNTGLVEFVVPGSVTYLGQNACGSCYSLESMIFEPSPTNTPLKCQIDQSLDYTLLTYMNVNRAFRFFRGDDEVDPSLGTGGLFSHAATAGAIRPARPQKVVLGEQLPEIYNYMFHNTRMVDLEIPRHITKIGEAAFKDCTYLTEVKIHNTITSIGKDAFGGCSAVNTLYIEDSDTPLPIGCSISAYEFTQSPFYESPLTNIYLGRDLVLLDKEGNPMEANNYYTGLLVTGFYDREDLIPHVTLGPKVTKITNHMFNYMPLESITIPDNITSIGDYAFRGCPNLTSITIPASVKSIGAHAFRECPKLANIALSSVESIGEQAFRSCKVLTSLSIPASVKTIGDDAFYDCTGLTKLTIEDSNEPLKIGYTYESTYEYGPFYASPLTTIYCGRNIKQVDDDGVEKAADGWEEGVFANKHDQLNSINLGGKLTKILPYMFAGTEATGVWIPNIITNIGDYAFEDCDKLLGITMGYDGLTQFPTIGSGVFNECKNTVSIKVRQEVYNDFLKHAEEGNYGWGNYGNRIITGDYN